MLAMTIIYLTAVIVAVEQCFDDLKAMLTQDKANLDTTRILAPLRTLSYV
ncbi:MAG: hypothetical protein HRT54_01305 [Colwellia sp.]|nr:hypothetical protein [Colwellia sp.]